MWRQSTSAAPHHRRLGSRHGSSMATAATVTRRAAAAMTPLLSSRRLTLVGARVGATVGKALLATAVEGQLTAEVLGEALVSSSTLRSHVRAEALRLVAVRLRMRAPRHLAWLVRLVTAYMTHASTSHALQSLSKRTLLYHITAFGVHGTVASALAAAAVQAGVCTCWLASSRVRRRVRRVRLSRRQRREHVEQDKDSGSSGDSEAVPSMAQYRYDMLTIACTAASTVVGGGVGAAVGSLVAPGFGTALGSIVCSSGGGLLVGCVRDRHAPAAQQQRQARALRAIAPLHMRDVDDGFVELTTTTAAAAAATTMTSGSGDTTKGNGDDDSDDVVQSCSDDDDDDDGSDSDSEAAFVCFSDDSEAERTDGDEDDCVLLATTTTTSTADAGDATAGAGGQCDDSGRHRMHVMRTRVDYVEGRSWQEVDDMVDALGDDEVVLLFCDDDTLAAATDTNNDSSSRSNDNGDKNTTAPPAV